VLTEKEIEDLLRELEAGRRREAALTSRLEHERAEKAIAVEGLRRASGQIEFLKALIEKLKRGHRSEKINPDQLELFPAVDAEKVAVAEEASDDEEVVIPQHRRKRRTKGRGPLPANLERREVIHDVDEWDKTCAVCSGAQMRPIGEEVTEELEYQPERFFVIAHKRKKYACPCCQRNVVTAPMPARVVPKGIPGPGLIAHVVTAKYADHLPLHRQEGIVARSGVEISRQTMCDWVGIAAALLLPIVLELKRLILSGPCVRLDATGVKMLAKGKTVSAHLWAYLRKNEIVVYDFTLRHTKSGPMSFLCNYRGYVQGDADTIYDPLFRIAPHLVEVACMAHCRRRFFDALETDGERARFALAIFRRLYAVEAAMKEDRLSAEQRTIARRELTRPILDELHAWLIANKAAVLPKSPIGEAVKYALKHWTPLTRFADEGALEIDNNDTERALRHVAIGRKNWLFAGNEEGGRRTAVLYSVVMTCKLNSVDPFAYLRDVLAERARNPAGDVAELTPMAWKARTTPSAG
jgi:transposase